MESDGGKEFRGSFPGFAKQMLAAVLPVAGVICLLLFGALAGRLFLVSLAIVPILLFLAWLMARLDRIRFDDADRVVRRNLRRPLAYDDVKTVRLIGSMGIFQVTVTRTNRRVELLMFGLRGRERAGLRQALTERCRGVEFEERSYAGWRLTVLAVVVLTALSAAGWIYLSRRAPETAMACQAAPAAIGIQSAREPIVRRGEGLVVSLPAEFGAAKFTVGSIVGFGQSGAMGRLFLRAAGIRTELQLLRYAACSRFGILPLILKSMLLGQWEEPQVHVANSETNEALMVTGARSGVLEARILVRNAGQEVEALVAVLLTEELGRERLVPLFGQVRVERSE